MRRNLRLDWRALALLGALLSIIIDWPGLVYAMPTILPPVTVAAPSDTLNVIKNDKVLNFYPFEHEQEHHVRHSVKDEFTAETTENSQSFSTNRPFSDVQTERTTNQEQLADVPVSARETEMQTERLTTNEKQKEVNENLYSISQKQINDNDRGAAAAALEDEGVVVEEVTVFHNATPQNSHVAQTTTEAEDEAEVSSTNTHNIMDSTTTTEASSTTNIPTSSPLSIIISSTTTESSAKIQSTLMPTTIIADNDNDNADIAVTKESQHIRSTFQFSASHHMAVLSRTERSIRSSSSTMNAKNVGGPSSASTGGGGGGRGTAGGGAGAGAAGIVRRSSDMGGVKTKRLNNSRNLHYKNNLDRNERSTVSHLSGPSRKIQMYIKNRFLQLMPDGTVNGTPDDQSEYTILQRSTVDVGRIKVQGVATCLYLCMDPCGAVYGSKDFTDDCVFNENMEQHNYNTYSSTYNSNARRKYYLALNRHGEPRKLQIPPTRSLGKLATYTNAITESVPQERVEQLIAKNFGANRIKHGIRQLCDTGKPLIELIDSKNFKAQPKCNPNSSNNSNNNSHSNSNSNSNSNTHNASSNKHKNNLSSSSSSLVNSNSGQLLNNVPAANDKNKLSNSPSSSSKSSSSSSSSSSSNSNSNSSNRPETNSSSSTSTSSSQSSISNSQNNGHISNSNSSSTTTTTTTNSNSNSSSSSSTMKANGPRGKKPRKCRPYENEEEHNCQRRPQAMRNPGRQRRCRELMLQQQQQGITDIVLPPMCKKKGPRKQGGKNKRPNGEARGKNGLGTDGLGPNNRRGKKLNAGGGGGGGAGGRQASRQNQNGGNGNGGGQKKKQKNPKRGGGGGGGGGNGKRKHQKTTTTTTTEKTSTSGGPSTLNPTHWETSSLVPTSTLFDNYDPHAESTSDRGDREQRNVRYSNSMEGSMEVSSEDTSAANDDIEDDDFEGDGENGDAGDDSEDVSYEDDSYVASSSHMPYAEADVAHPPLTGGADDILYYDQFDV